MTPIIFTAAIAWALSQILKVIVGFIRIGRGESSRIVWRLVWAGGMPSSHSAFTTSCLIAVGLVEGIDSSLFGVAFVLTAIVIYDRSKLHHMFVVFRDRFPILADLAEEDPIVNDLVGHRTSEILAGVAIGVLAAGLGWFLFMR